MCTRENGLNYFFINFFLAGSRVSDRCPSCYLLFDFFFILAGNKDIHKSLHECEFQPDLTPDYGVSCH